MPNNIWGDQLISYGFSFHHTDEYNSIQDSLQSYKCGSMVGADFCYVEVARKWDAVEQSQIYSCSELAFSTDGQPEGGDENPGPLTWMNTISAIVLKAAKEPNNPIDPPLPPVPFPPTPTPNPPTPQPPQLNGCVTTFYSGPKCDNSDSTEEQDALLGDQSQPSFPWEVKSVRLNMQHKIHLYNGERFFGYEVIQANMFERTDEADDCICFSLEDMNDMDFSIVSYKLIDLAQ